MKRIGHTRRQSLFEHLQIRPDGRLPNSYPLTLVSVGNTQFRRLTFQGRVLLGTFQENKRLKAYTDQCRFFVNPPEPGRLVDECLINVKSSSRKIF
jgi:hypothetical protein